MAQNKWRRYRFQTFAVDDYRPLVWDPRYPWWCSGHALTGTVDDPQIGTSIIIAWLPIGEDLLKYWDDAFDIEYTDHAAIEFSDRFPKDASFIES